MASECISEALKSQVHYYCFVFSLNTGHCNSKVYEQNLAETLLWMWGDYKAE
jgi:hypothetical protein